MERNNTKLSLAINMDVTSREMAHSYWSFSESYTKQVNERSIKMQNGVDAKPGNFKGLGVR